MGTLEGKKCVPCRGGIPPLALCEAEKLLKEIPGWNLASDNPPRIRREFGFKDFREALGFVNRVGELAEQEGHHPNISIHDWNRVALELYTHKIGGLHENDFILAAKVNNI